MTEIDEIPRVAGLIAQIASANAADLAHTTNLLLAGKDDDRLKLANALLAIEEILDDAKVIDRATERRLGYIYHHFDHARITIESVQNERKITGEESA